MNNYGQEINASPGCENKAPGIWGAEEGCDDFDYFQGSTESRRASDIARNQPQRTDREVRQRGNFPTGGKILGGTISQLIKDCLSQKAGNDEAIEALQKSNELLDERLSFYQQLLAKIAEAEE